MSFQDGIYMIAGELGTSCPTLRTVGQHPYFGR